MKARAALVAGALSTFLVLLLAAPAGAAPPIAAGASSAVGKVTVSDPAPIRDTIIEVSSTGWRPNGLVLITMSGIKGTIARGVANSTGAVRLQVAIPKEVRLGFNVLAVSGHTAAGVPQEIVTGLKVIRRPDTGRRVRPWTAVYSLAFLATLLLLLNQKLINRKFAVGDGEQLAEG